MTNRMIQAARLMATPVMDHVIISKHGYYSFKESELLAKLAMSSKYVLPYELEQEFYDDMQAEIKKVEEKNRQHIYDLEKLHYEEMQSRVKKGMEKGMEKGAKKKKLEIAKQMLDMGLDMEVIQQATGLISTEIPKDNHNKDKIIHVKTAKPKIFSHEI